MVVVVAEEAEAPAERVLVLGTEELMYLPMRLAEGLADPGVANVDVLTHAAITGLKVDGLVAAAPRGRYQLPE